MLIRKFTFAVVMMLLGSVLLAGPLTSACQAQTDGVGITLDFKDIELTDLIRTVSELTGKNFVYDDSIRGKATIISSQQMSVNEAYQLFLTVLNVKGYTVVPSGKTNKIVPIKSAKESNLPTMTGNLAQDQFVTRMISLENINAADIAESILSPLMPKTSNVVVYEPSNMLIISDSASNIQRLTTIIRELDVPGALQDMQVIPLQFADAKETATICNDILSSGNTKATSRRRASKNVTTSSADATSKVIAYERTNRLVVMATSDDMTTILSLIAELDQEPTQEHARINLYYLENADAEELSKTLNEILSGIKKPATSSSAAAGGKGTIPAAAIQTNVTVSADKPTNALVINATPEDYVIIKDIIKQLDIRRKQVYVEALIMELSMDATEALGSQLQGAFEVGNEGIVNLSSNSAPGGILSDPESLLTTSVNGLLAGGFSKLIGVDTDGDGVDDSQVTAFSALIKLSKDDTNVNILSAPRLLTSDNEEAEIVVGRNVPIITSRLTDSTGSDSLAQSVSVERKDVALTLRFTPQITEGELVRLNVYQETTDLTDSVGDVNSVGPTFTTRKISNTVLARDGQTVVLGGLISTNQQETISKVPLLGDIPLLGWLFKSKDNKEVKTNLLVFITPTIISDMEDLSNVTTINRETFDRIKNDPEASNDNTEQN
ncbi:type II secretion system secretin GspD [Desulfuromonas acetoxidans]|uniref:Type II and III secretion system protein n=1 Tax=Desulfuromonas acetoxidans (strain DSM 684 / 11070) TaxID=281689 RepID=Q1JVV5_DESA6|nr:type II secretion system secretin GspD [Desulfuromonas acetoxidans]EAT14371.1 type II and III secretion system protein [Desulfuromonas acetoxidans DSM 684]MBF0647020.1 type II secretion system secretin GspD [Desulfuromonas acetoxidans]NVD26023.1 type II secretion system secretin GspD [Desulfuromonas acetoxidans]NVE16961.1 type II secretion system secretin GspD [Desulfuromonas acetoxidans]